MTVDCWHSCRYTDGTWNIVEQKFLRYFGCNCEFLFVHLDVYVVCCCLRCCILCGTRIVVWYVYRVPLNAIRAVVAFTQSLCHTCVVRQALVSAAAAERSATVRRAEAAAVARLALCCSEARTTKLAEQIRDMARCLSNN